MSEYNLDQIEDFQVLYSRLRDAHAGRIAKNLALQAMWESAIVQAPSGRTLYVNNEPATATRLTLALIARGDLAFKGDLPPGPGGADPAERLRVVEQVEKLLRAHYHQTDYRLFGLGQGISHKKKSAWNLAVYGWNCGLNLVQDAVPAGEWPILSEVWSPLDTYRDMDGTGIMHVSRMSLARILGTFGKNRPGGKALPGYSFDPPVDAKPSDLFAVAEFFDEGTAATAVMQEGSYAFLKKQVEHHLGCNPAWMQALDAPPFRTSASDAKGKGLDSPDWDSNRWLEFYGQSPMLAYEGPYRVLSEMMNLIGDTFERWANSKVIIKSNSGKLVQIDWQDPLPAQVDGDTTFDVIAPPKLPADDRALVDLYRRDISKGSYPESAYGVGVSAESAIHAWQMLQVASGPIIEPIVDHLGFEYTWSAENILKQLTHQIPRGKGKSVSYSQRKTQYETPRPARLHEGKTVKVAWFTIKDVPDDIVLSASLRGAGVPKDDLQTLAVLNGIQQSPNPVLSLETLLEKYTNVDDVAGELSRISEQQLTSAPGVLEKLAPIFTLQRFAKRFAQYGTPEGDTMADMSLALASGTAKELAAMVQNDAAKAARGEPPSQPGQPQPMPNGGPPPGMPPMDPMLMAQMAAQQAPPMGPPPGMPMSEPMMPPPGAPMGMPNGAPPMGMPPEGPADPQAQVQAFFDSVPPQLRPVVGAVLQALPPDAQQQLVELILTDPGQAAQLILALVQRMMANGGGGRPNGMMGQPSTGGPPGQGQPGRPAGVRPTAQVPGVAPAGAPVAGMAGVPTGPQPMRGYQMQQARAMRPPTY